MKSSKILVMLISLGVAGVLGELTLRWLTVFPIHAAGANRIPDDRLGYRVDPSLEDVDDHGFRNRRVPDGGVDIVALGDSHTYGYNVDSEDSWPQKLAAMTGMSVYNFGVGGYGTLHYLQLMDEAVKLDPRHVIVGLYLANDLHDTCELITEMDFWSRWAEERGYDTRLCVNTERPVHRRPGESSNLLLKTAIGSMIAHVWSRMPAQQAADAIVVQDEANRTVIKRGRVSTHASYMDLEQTDISLSFEIAKDAFREAGARARSLGVDFGIVFLPSKERVFFDYLVEHGYQLPDDYRELVANEDGLVDRFSSFFEELGIKCVDAKPYVVRKLDAGHVYPYPDNGHPLEPGYEAYARAVYEKLILDAGA